jgi:hypothetical protein
MTRLTKIFFLFILLILISHNSGFGQSNIAQADTSRTLRSQAEGLENAENKAGYGNKMQEAKGQSDNQQSIKKVRSARPDMTKARGARPAYIQRQSGSGIPRGIGRPSGAGAVKPGKR